MQGSKYFNNTRPTEDQLNHTEDTKENSLKRRLNAACQMGIVNGFQLLKGGIANAYSIAAGEGYTGGKFPASECAGEGSGERISTNRDTSLGYVSGTYVVVDQLFANVLATVYYVSLVYSEDATNPLSEVYYPFDVHQTLYWEHWTVETVTQATWNNPALMTSAMKRNRILIGLITGTGGMVTDGSIQQVVQPKTHPVTTQPTLITGVTILQISDNTPIGDGLLEYEINGGGLLRQIRWTAPPDVLTITWGAWQPIGVTGGFTLLSGTASYTATIDVDATLLPIGNQHDHISISSLYGATVPRFSAVDSVHRDMVGTGQVSATNPHGLSENDISTGNFAHADLYHVNGISIDADTTQLGCAIDGGLRKINITNTGGVSNSFLIEGNSYTLITGYTAGFVGVVQFAVGDTAGRYLVYLDGTAVPNKILISTISAATLLPIANVTLIDMQNRDIGACNLTWTGSTTNQFTYTAVGDGLAGTPVQIDTTSPGYYKVYSSDTYNWVIVYVSADPGVTAVATFTSNMVDTTHAPGKILKLCTVDWNIGGILNLTGPADIRQWKTADNREDFLAEHDLTGKHNKVLQQPFRVAAATGPSIYGTANNTGLYGVGGDSNLAICGTGVAGVGSGSAAFPVVGVYGIASNVLVTASATGVYGVASAESATGVYGLAPAGTGVVGSGGLVGFFGTCVTAFAGTGSAVANTIAYGVNVTATNAVDANSAIGVRGYVPGIWATGVYGHATGNSATGVYGFAPGVDGTGVYGNAPLGIGIYFGGGTVGGYFTVSNTVNPYAGTVRAVYGSAFATNALYAEGAKFEAVNDLLPGSAIGVQGAVVGVSATGVYGIATGNNGTGVFGSAPGVIGTGVYGKGVGTGVFGSGATGAYCTAGGVYAVYGAAPNSAVVGVAPAGAGSVGVFGTASNYGVYGMAAANTGVFGTAVGSYGVFGSAPNTAVAGSAPAGAGSVGVFGTASNYGVYGAAAADLGVYGIAVGSYGVYGTAANSAVAGVVPAGAGVVGVFGSASNSAICGSAAANIGVYGYAAANTGVFGTAAGVYGVCGAAPNSAIYGIAAVLYGVVGTAPSYGVGGYAATSIGVFGSAGGDIGVAGAAVANTGVYGIATVNYGGYFKANASLATGLFGTAASDGTGCGGIGGKYGIYAGGGAADIIVEHGTAIPAIEFDEVNNGAPGGAIAKHVYVIFTTVTYALALYATAP